MNRTVKQTVLALACTLSAVTAQAAPNLFEGQASIRNLAVEVIDLRPDDGIAPAFVAGKHKVEGSAQWLDGGYLFNSDYGWEGDIEVASTQTQQGLKGIFGGPDFQFQLPDGQAKFGRTNGNYAAQISMNTSDILVTPSDVPGSTLRADMKISTQSWLLKPGTEVRISGTFDLSLLSDPTQLSPDLFPDNEFWGPWHYAELGANVNLRVVGGGDGVIVGPGSIGSNILTNVLASNEALTGGRTQSFVLVARNTGNQDVTLQSDLSVGAKYRFATAVPEPSTWACLAPLPVVARPPDRHG